MLAAYPELQGEVARAALAAEVCCYSRLYVVRSCRPCRRWCLPTVRLTAVIGALATALT